MGMLFFIAAAGGSALLPAASVFGELAVFLPCSHAAPDMTLLLVHIEDASHLGEQCIVFLSQSFADILVYCAFGYSELTCGAAHGGSVFYNVLTEHYCSLSGPGLHIITPVCLKWMRTVMYMLAGA